MKNLIINQFKDLIKKDLRELNELLDKNKILKECVFEADLSKEEKMAAMIYGIMVDTAITYKQTDGTIKDAISSLKGNIKYILKMDFS